MLVDQLKEEEKKATDYGRKARTTPPTDDQLEKVLTFDSHVAGVTVELLVSYSDFSPGF